MEEKDTEGLAELDRKYGEEPPSREFADLLSRSGTGGGSDEVAPGQKVKGVIRTMDASSAFVDYGGRSEAVIDLQELRDRDGALTYREGDAIEAFVAAAEGEVRLTRSLRASGREVLQEAFQAGMPIEGRVTGFNTGGLTVNISGQRAFCPLSQIEIGFCQDPGSYAGKTLAFRIIELREGGRNIVVSRRALLEEEARRRARELKDKLKVGQEFDGRVTRVERFGAFVDIGGIEGLLHVSEISHTRVGSPKDVLKPGDPVRVRILELQNLGGEKERISLSIKALLPDPWDAFRQTHSEGQVVKGKVSSIQKFGAFVEIAPGVDGLVHISQLSEKRVNNPADVVRVGQEVTVRIQGIEAGQRRISLSIKAAEAESAAAAETADMEDFRSKEKEKAGTIDNAMAEALRRAGLLHP